MTIIIDEGYTRTQVIICNIHSVADIDAMKKRIIETIANTGEKYDVYHLGEEIDIGPPDPNEGE